MTSCGNVHIDDAITSYFAFCLNGGTLELFSLIRAHIMYFNILAECPVLKKERRKKRFIVFISKPALTDQSRHRERCNSRSRACRTVLETFGKLLRFVQKSLDLSQGALLKKRR